MTLICEKCGINIVDTNNYYMTKDSVWTSKADKDELLCIKCFESRIGRKLTVGDLIIAPINKVFMLTRVFGESICNKKQIQRRILFGQPCTFKIKEMETI